jgi:hypothetical protein
MYVFRISLRDILQWLTDLCNLGQVIRIDILPDDVLLEIFDFYMDMSPLYEGKTGEEAWQSLAHVCRRWRGLVFGSPSRLNL